MSRDPSGMHPLTFDPGRRSTVDRVGSMRISDVTDRTGLPATALRFYEKVGIVVPGRAPNGYRAYSDEDLERLTFVVRAKAVGLTLQEATELLALRDGDECAPVQDRLSTLVSTRRDETLARAAELTGFADDLGAVLHRLASQHPDGPCDLDCSCLTDELTDEAAATAPRPLQATAHHAAASLDVAQIDACSLERSLVTKRLEEWRDLFERCTVRWSPGEDAEVDIPADVDLGEIARLAAAETECCSFFEFDLRVDAAGRRLTVHVPDQHADALAALFGETS
jgi:DNA-binding transcriptional MerR regulator